MAYLSKGWQHGDVDALAAHRRCRRITLQSNEAAEDFFCCTNDWRGTLTTHHPVTTLQLQARLTAQSRTASGGKRQERPRWTGCPHQNPQLDDLPEGRERMPERWHKRKGNTNGGAKHGWLVPPGSEGQSAPSLLPTGKQRSGLRVTTDLLSRQRERRGELCQNRRRALDTWTACVGELAEERHHLPLRIGGEDVHPPALEKPTSCPRQAVHHRREGARPQQPPNGGRRGGRREGPKSRRKTLVETRAPASRQTRAAAFSNENPRLPSTPDRGHAARWWPKMS